jgi:hypothetical protein
MWWGGLALLFGAGLVAGLALAQPAAAEESIAEFCGRAFGAYYEGREWCEKRQWEARGAAEGGRRSAMPIIGRGYVPDDSGAGQGADELARQTREQATDACEAQWGRNALMVEHCRKQAR